MVLFLRAAMVAAGIMIAAPFTLPVMANGENAASATRIVSEGEGLPSGKSLPTDEKELRFLGMWAADAALCKEMAWRFSEHELRTPAGSVCQFSTISEAQGGYDIQARCTSEGPTTDDVLSLRFAESAQAMLFESDSIADAGLIYCGTLEQE